MGIIDSFKDWKESRRVEGEDVGSGLLSLNLKRLSSLPQQHGFQGNGLGYGFYNLSNTKIDFSREVGDLRNVALVQSAIGWVARNLYDARLKTVQLDGDNKETEVKPDELAKLFYRPNPFYSGQALAAGIALSWITAQRAYLIKVKGGFGNTVQLWYEPHWTIEPRWDKEGKDLISYYEIWRNGKWKRIEVDDVIAICNGIDPDTRHALINPVQSLLREFYTENQAAHFMSLLLRNGLVPPVVISVGDKERPFDGDIEPVKASILRKMSGDSAGEPMVTNDAVTVSKLGYDYSSVGLKDVRQIPVNRFCAAMGISPISLMLDAGDSTHANYNNVSGYLRQDYRGYIVPLHNLIASEFDTHLLPDFGEAENRSVKWDYSQTALMAPDQLLRARTSTMIWEKNGIDRAEYREAVGYKMRDEDIGVYYSDMEKPKAEEEPEATPLEVERVDAIAEKTAQKVLKAMGLPASDLDAAAEEWRNHPALGEVERSLIDAKPYVNGKPS